MQFYTTNKKNTVQHLHHLGRFHNDSAENIKVIYIKTSAISSEFTTHLSVIHMV